MTEHVAGLLETLGVGLIILAIVWVYSRKRPDPPGTLKVVFRSAESMDRFTDLSARHNLTAAQTIRVALATMDHFSQEGSLSVVDGDPVIRFRDDPDEVSPDDLIDEEVGPDLIGEAPDEPEEEPEPIRLTAWERIGDDDG